MTATTETRIDRTYLRSNGRMSGHVGIRPEHRHRIAELAGPGAIAVVGHYGVDRDEKDPRFVGRSVLLSMAVDIAPDGTWSWGGPLGRYDMTDEQRAALIAAADPAKTTLAVGTVMAGPGERAGDSISFGQVRACGLPGTEKFLGYVHSCGGGRVERRPTVEGAFADAHEVVRHDSLYGQSPTTGPNAYVTAGGDIVDQE